MFDAMKVPEAGSGGIDPSAIPYWIGYMAYDACASHARVEGGPGLCFGRYPAVIAIDHHAARSFVAGDDARACERLLALAGLAADGGALNGAGSCLPQAGGRVGPVHAADPAEHARAIERALELIGRGELYQVNLARKLCAPFERAAFDLALAMREESPVPLGMFFEDGERAVIARTMERFLRWKLPERRLHTRPIKGTTPREDRGASRESEEQRALVADPKEHAEHAMIVDLMRNDLGRVAAVGSVEVVEQFVVEPFARLHHLVSTVACTTRPETRRSDVLRATFPPGSVTGTPKLRAIEVIDALEPAARGIYTGAVGFIDRAGGLSLAVAIRTAVVERGVASYFAGGGIVEASDIEREIAETELKARVFTDAIAKLAEPR
jgi:para-aminobenzoate synthetase component 1